MLNKDFAGHASGSLLGKLIAACADGKDPVTDATVGAGVGTAGLVGFGLVIGAPVTLPALAIMGAMGAVIGYCSGQKKKNGR